MSSNRMLQKCRTFFRHSPTFARVGLAAIGCGVCCGLPLVALAGIGGGAAGTILGVPEAWDRAGRGRRRVPGHVAALTLRARLRRATACDCGPACPLGRHLPEHGAPPLR